MTKTKFIALLLTALLCSTSLAHTTEDEDRNARVVQWESYALPAAEFTRFVDKKQGFSLWRPAAWKEAVNGRGTVSFGAQADRETIKIIPEQIPEGLGVANYTTAILQHLRKVPVKLESFVVRHVLIGGVEGREISYELEGDNGTVRQIYWVAQVGPTAYNFVLTTLPEEQEKLEPYFKRLMMSVRFNVAGHWDEEFETLRAKLANGGKSAQDAEAARLSEAIRTTKEPTAQVTQRIAELAKTAPEIALEMLTDYDPNVRAAAIAALGQASDARFTEALIWALTDKDAFCSTSAARALAERGAAGITALKSKLPKLVAANGALLRVAAFVSDESARELADELLKSDDAALQQTGLRMAVAFPLRGLRLPYAKLFSTDSVFVIGHTMEAIRLRRPTEDVPEFVKMLGTDAELWAIHALGELATPAIIVQLEERQKTLGARYDKLLSSKGVMTIRGGTSSLPPPPPPMPKRSGAKKSARQTPPPEILRGVPGEYSFTESSSPASTPPALYKTQPELTKLWSGVIELEDAISKIKFRDRWANAKDATARRTILDEANTHDRLKDWARTTLRNDAPNSAINLDLTKLQNVPTSGETLFPGNATLYLTAPNFEQTIGKLDAAFAGIQMGTVRDQMTFALMLNQLKAQLASKMNTNITGSASHTLGIDLKAPISMAAWPSETATKADAMAHSAVVVRVTDRARFERTLTMYQTDFGGFASFVPVVSIGSRVASITPAAMPLMFYAISAISDLASTMTSSEKVRPAKFSGGSSVYARQERLGNVPVTVIEKLGYVGIDATNRECIYIAYLGDTAVLAPTREALLDVLNTNKATITSNPSYSRIKAESGEIVFFSQLDTLLKNLLEGFSSSEKTPTDMVMNELVVKAIGAETGAVRLSSSAWDSIFHVAVGDNDIVKSVRPFKATELGAPRDLLPKQTLFYVGTVIDPAKFAEAAKRWDAEITKAWKASGKAQKKEKTNDTFSQLFSAFQNLVAPHLQGEISLAVTSISNLFKNDARLPSIVVALKLKNDTLAKVARSGLLSVAFKRVPNETALNAPIFKMDDGEDTFYVTITDNYFVLANSVETLKSLGGKETLATARDFAAPASSAPERLALFSTLSIEAALADVRTLFGKNQGKDDATNQFVEMMSAWAHAFHSYRMLIAFADDKTLEGQLGVSFDREGRYNVGAMNRNEFDVENALIAPKGVNILKATRVAALKLKVSTKQPGVIARVKEDLSKFAWQKVEPNVTESSLVFTSHERRIPEKLTVKLPVKSAEFEPYLKATYRINSDSPEIIQLAKEIAGKDRDGRSVARKIGAWTFENLQWKRVSSTSVQTLASREADCLEHAELYVALARASGLPARVVSGAAFSEGSFGAHAWVEIYLGQWVEIDPTWGLSEYVDATHLRFDGDGFISYAQLNQVGLEVLETRAFVADYQRDPIKLVKALASEENDDLPSMIFDLELTAEQALGAGALAKLNDKQRDAVINAFDRAVEKMGDDWLFMLGGNPGILSSEVKSNRASILVVFGDRLLKVSLAARDSAWFVTEIEDADDGERAFAETLQNALNPALNLAQIRTLGRTNPERALKQLETFIATKGESAPLLLLKADILRVKAFRQLMDESKEKAARAAKDGNSEAKPVVQKRPNETAALLETVTTRWPDYAPAHYALARAYQFDEETRAKAVAPYQRYAQLMPLDPRPWENLAWLFEQSDRLPEAETAFREAIARDRENIGRQADLIAFYLRQTQMDKAKASLATMLKQAPDANAVFASVDGLVRSEDEDLDAETAKHYEELLLSAPKELSSSADGLRGLAEAQRVQQKYDAAVKSLQKVVVLQPDSGDQVSIAAIYREAKRFAPALAAADQAIKRGAEDASAYYERACALAQLGRKREALAALKKMIELNKHYAYGLAEEADLQPLATLPEFKALLPKTEEAAEADAKPEPAQSKAAKP